MHFNVDLSNRMEPKSTADIQKKNNTQTSKKFFVEENMYDAHVVKQ